MTKTLGLIGSGNVGTAVAHLAVAAGLNVMLSNSRGPQTLTGLLDELGERATAATPEEAAQAGDLVVLAIPFAAYPKLPADALTDRIVLDTTNYYPDRDGQPPAELVAGTATQSELVQRLLSRSRVVKAFNTILPGHLRSLARPAGPWTVAPCPSPGTTYPPRPMSPRCSIFSAGTPSTRAHSPTAGA